MPSSLLAVTPCATADNWLSYLHGCALGAYLHHGCLHFYLGGRIAEPVVSDALDRLSEDLHDRQETMCAAPL